MYCSNCGAEINDNAVVCIKCGCAVNKPSSFFGANEPSKEWIICLLLCFFLGYLGIHRFYTGRIGTGIAMLLTCGGCGIWALIDLIMIILGKFENSEGRIIK